MRYFAHAITAIEISYWHSQFGLVGDTWLCDVEYIYEKNTPQIDKNYAELKILIQNFLIDNFDYTLLIPQNMFGLQLFEYTQGMCLKLEKPWFIEIKAPRQAFTLLDCSEITFSEVGKLLTQRLLRHLPTQIAELKLSFRHDAQTPNQSFHFCHGLPEQVDKSQRIMHGHYGRLTIWHEGILEVNLSALWCERLNYCYFADQNNLSNGLENQQVRLAYHSQQGYFSIQLPTKKVIVLAQTPSLENIARWLIGQLALNLHGNIAVQLFGAKDQGVLVKTTR